MALSPPQQQIEPYASLLEEQHLIKDLPGWDAPLRPQSHGRSAFVDPSLPASPLSTTPQRLLSNTRAFETLFKELCPYDVRVCIDHGVAVRAVRFLPLGCRQARSGHRRRAFRWTTGRVRGRAERREGPGGGAKPDPASRQDEDEPRPAQSRPVIPGCIGGPGVVLPSDAERDIRHPHHRAGEPKGARIQVLTWEQRKLGEVASFGKGVGYSKSDIKESGTGFLHYGRLYTAYGLAIEAVDTFADYREGSLISTGREVVTPSSGETADDIAIAAAVVSPGILLGGGLNVVYPEDVLNPVFLALSISSGSQHAELVGKAQGKSVVHMYNDDLAESHLRLPSLSEQSRIGALFQKLDSLITLHQREGLCGKY